MNTATKLLLPVALTLAIAACSKPAEQAAAPAAAEAPAATAPAEAPAAPAADTATLGKTPGKDSANDKPTYPALLGLPAAKSYALELRDQAIAALSPWGESAEPLRALARFIVARNS